MCMIKQSVFDSGLLPGFSPIRLHHFNTPFHPPPKGPELFANSPAVLTGSVDRCCDLLIERRERFGISYIQLKSDIETAAPIVARLAGA